jgi:2-polyprenyl-3-methyl-5-hydroxy-6-metoxy-1,4-benzoquinol methylase
LTPTPERRRSALVSVKRTFETLGRDDPLYAVLSRKGLRHNRWDPADFFDEGKKEISNVMAYVERLGLTVGRDRALDFGCGVGRLSQALADHFESVVGVDISESMIERAHEYNTHGERVHYLVNATENIEGLEGAIFDFAYSNKTLQHIPPDSARVYIREIFRTLRPGGVTVFQVPNGKALEPGSVGAWLYSLRRIHLRRVWKIVRGLPPIEMHYIARSQVERIVEESGGRVLDVVDIGRGGTPNKSLRYCAIKRGLETRTLQGP